MSWAKAWPGPADAANGFWSSGAAEEASAAPGTASGGNSEAQEDSNLSVYDNLHMVSLRHRLEGGGHFESNDPGGHAGPCGEEAELEEVGQTRDSSSSWSSCEVLPLDEGAVRPDVSPKTPVTSSRVSGEENGDKDDHEDGDDNQDSEEDDYGGGDNVHHPNSPASCSAVSDSNPLSTPLSTGSSEVFLPSCTPDLQVPEPQPGGAHSLLAKLRHQMARRKAEYQTRIQR